MNTTTNEVIGKRIKTLRNKLGLSQKDFASKLWDEGFNTSYVSISKYENGKGSIPIDLLVAMSRVLNCTVADITGQVLDDESARVANLLREAANLIEAKDIEINRLKDTKTR